MKKIRILAPPSWNNPEEFLYAFVGIVIPINRDVLNRLLLERPEVWEGATNEVGHVVLTEDAVTALEVAGEHAAADYWHSEKKMVLKFRNDICEIIED